MGREWQALTLALGLLGLLLTMFLTGLHLRPELTTPVCTLLQSDCDKVLSSRYSTVFGLSLPSLGCCYYLAVCLSTLWLTGSRRPEVTFFLLALTRLGLAVSLFLVGLQAFVLKAFCLLCCASAACCLALFLVVSPSRLELEGDRTVALRWTVIAVLLLACTPLLFRVIAQPRRLSRVDYAMGHCLGEPQAELKLVVFSDFQCPHCRGLFAQLYPLVQRNSTRMLLCYRPFPLASHFQAWKASAAAEAAAQQGKFWEYAELLYQPGRRLDDDDLQACARQLGLDIPRFESARHSDAVQERITREQAEARSGGVAAVPAVFVNQVQEAADASLGARLLAR